MQNPFRQGVFPHIGRELAQYVADSDEPDKAVSRLVVGEARRRLFEGRLVEAYDWDDVVAKVAADLYGQARTSALALPPPPSLDIAELVRYYCGLPGMVRSLPGAHEVLRSLKSRGHTLVVVSNGYHKYQLPVLRTLGLDVYFSDIYTPEQVGAAKPSPGIFHAAWHGECAPVHVGDDIVHDAYGARAAGGYSVWLHRKAPEERPEGAGEVDVPPERRVECPSFADVRNRAFAATWAVEAFGVAPGDCVPHALIWDLMELPDLVDRLDEAEGRGGSRHVVDSAQCV